MHLITPFKCMLTLALHLPCNWRPQNGTMNKAERAERTPPVLPLGTGGAGAVARPLGKHSPGGGAREETRAKGGRGSKRRPRWGRRI